MTKNDYFPKIIGQNNAKQRLGFKLDVFNNNSPITQPIAIFGQRGGGKTTLMRSFAKNLKSRILRDENGELTNKPYVEVSAASFKSVSSFVDAVVNPYRNAEVTVGIDEAHALDSKVHDWLLSVFIPDSQSLVSRVSHAGSDYEFDYRMITFILATTNPEKLSNPMKSRFFVVELEDYSVPEIERIIQIHAGDVRFSESSLRGLAEVSRNTARTAKDLALSVKDFLVLKKNDKHSFNVDDLRSLKSNLRIYPLGLSESEVKLLRALRNKGALTLTVASNVLQMDATTVRRDVERFLLERGLIYIDGKRFITPHGQKILDLIDNNN